MDPLRVIPTQQVSVSASPTSRNPGLSTFVSGASGITIVGRHPVPSTSEALAYLIGCTVLDALSQQAPEFVSPRGSWMLSLSINLATRPLESLGPKAGNDTGDDSSTISPGSMFSATVTKPAGDSEHISWLRSLRHERS